MKKESIGLIGFGAIGQDIYRKISRNFIYGYKVVGVFSEDINEMNLIPTLKCQTLPELLKKKPKLIIEAASVNAVKEYAEIILKNKIDFLCLSVCSFADKIFFKRICKLNKKIKSKIYISTGAIAGLDAISAAALSKELQSVQLIQRKPPLALLERKTAASLKKPKILSNKTARKTCLNFPSNSNIAGTLSICGIGFDKTKVIIIVDPKIKKNIAEINAFGKFGKLKIILENNPSSNPKTSRLTSMSVLESLNKRKKYFLCPF